MTESDPARDEAFKLVWQPKSFKKESPKLYGEFCLKAVKLYGLALVQVPEKFRTAEVCLEAVKQNGYALECLPKKLRTTELCFEAVKQCGRALSEVPENLKTPELCFEAVKQEGMAIQDVPTKLRTAEICLVAVKQTGWKAFQYVPKNLKTLELCLEAVKHNEKNIEPLNKEKALEAVRQDGRALRYVHKKHITHKICNEAVKNVVGALRYVPEIHTTQEQYLEAVKNFVEVHGYVPKKFKTQELINIGIDYIVRAEEFFPESMRDEISRILESAEQYAKLTTKGAKTMKITNKVKSPTAVRLAVVVIVVILIMLIPLPPPAIVLCILIALNVVLAIVIFLIALFSKNITDFSRFPAVLLISTIFGLAVNIFSARFILFKVDDKLIQTAVSLAAGSGSVTRLIIGYAGSIVLAALLIIVIAKGAVRVSELAAIFILNTMQFKLMTVETEYSSGLITEEEAIIRKNAVQREGDFFEALDAAVKFISGSIKIAIFIMAVTILVGIACVMLQGQSFADAVNTYIPLSILNGLQFLFTILLLSIAASLSVIRSGLGNQEK